MPYPFMFPRKCIAPCIIESFAPFSITPIFYFLPLLPFFYLLPYCPFLPPPLLPFFYLLPYCPFFTSFFPVPLIFCLPTRPPRTKQHPLVLLNLFQHLFLSSSPLVTCRYLFGTVPSHVTPPISSAFFPYYVNLHRLKPVASFTDQASLVRNLLFLEVEYSSG